MPSSPRLSVLQCTLFAKSTENNWLVCLHQDLSIPVAERVDSPGCHGWSEKEGGLFVQPPASVLEGVLALRLHLDDCNERNGARMTPVIAATVPAHWNAAMLAPKDCASTHAS